MATKKKARKKAKVVKKKLKVKKKATKKVVAKKSKKNTKKKVSTKKTLKKKPIQSVKKATKAAASVEAPTKHPLLESPAPDVAVVNQRGERVSLKELASAKKNLVLYFYPKDDTPGCTKEACNFRDNLNRIADKDTVIVGVSPDSPESHQKFIEKYQINFDLLSDSEKELANLFKVWKEKEFMGNKYWGVDRSTFLFSNGVLKHVWQPVKVDGHVDEVLNKIS